MGSDDLLDDYGVAYLCEGSQRVAVVALVALCETGRIEIAPARHRVRAVRREAGHPVEQAALDAIPEHGRVLGEVVNATAESAAVEAVRASLVRLGLLRRWRPASRTIRGRKMRHQLTAEPPQPGRRAVAVTGADGIADSSLRHIFTTPDPARLDLPEHPRRPDKIGNDDDPGGDYTSHYVNWQGNHNPTL